MVYEKTGSGNSDLDYGLDWLCKKVERVLDFGCGSGDMLRLCAARGTKIHMGVDMSPGLIMKAQRSVDKTLRFYFRCGTSKEFKTLLSSSFDGAILSGILELLSTEEAMFVLEQTYRVLNKDGKALIKLGASSAFSVDEWGKAIGERFNIKELRDVYYKDRDVHEYMFLAFKQEDEQLLRK